MNSISYLSNLRQELIEKCGAALLDEYEKLLKEKFQNSISAETRIAHYVKCKNCGTCCAEAFDDPPCKYVEGKKHDWEPNISRRCNVCDNFHICKLK